MAESAAQSGSADMVDTGSSSRSRGRRRDQPSHVDAADEPLSTDEEAEDPHDNEDKDQEDRYNFTPPTQQSHRPKPTNESYTETENAQVLQKLDRNLTLFLTLLYLLSFLDRSNIGNARVAGLQQSLSITSSQFDMTLLAFYMTYITFEWMILLYRFVPPHIYISACVFSWGLVACLQATVTSFPALLACRAVLGVTEAAFGPGVPFYMTFFYRREELAARVGVQISAAPLATAFAGALAWVIVQVSEWVGLVEGWRALFLIEGFPSIVVAVFAWYVIPDGPESVGWLSPRERRVAVLRLESEKEVGGRIGGRKGSGEPKAKFDVRSVVKTLVDPKAWLPSLMFFSVNIGFASLPVFLPTIINDMSFSPLTSQILAAPAYLLAFFYVLVVSRASDRIKNSRGWFLMISAALSSFSYAVIAVVGFLASRRVISPEGALAIYIRYVAVYGAAMGLFGSVVLVITWQLNNQESVEGKGVAMVILNVVGQTGPLLGVKLFPGEQAPFFIMGMMVCSGFMALVVLLSWALRTWLGRLNRVAEGEVGRGRYEMVALTSGSGGDGDEDDLHEVEEIVDGGSGRHFTYML